MLEVIGLNTELRKLSKGKPTKAPVEFLAWFALDSLATGRALAVRAELRKLSQGKPTTAPVEFIARLALDALRNAEVDDGLTELERMYRLPDIRA